MNELLVTAGIIAVLEQEVPGRPAAGIDHRLARPLRTAN